LRHLFVLYIFIVVTIIIIVILQNEYESQT